MLQFLAGVDGAKHDVRCWYHKDRIILDINETRDDGVAVSSAG